MEALKAKLLCWVLDPAVVPLSSEGVHGAWTSSLPRATPGLIRTGSYGKTKLGQHLQANLSPLAVIEDFTINAQAMENTFNYLTGCRGTRTPSSFASSDMLANIQGTPTTRTPATTRLAFRHYIGEAHGRSGKLACGRGALLLLCTAGTRTRSWTTSSTTTC